MSLFMINGAVANMNSLVLGGVADQIGMELLLPGSSLLCSVLVVLLVMTVPVLRRLDHILDQLRAAKT